VHDGVNSVFDGQQFLRCDWIGFANREEHRILVWISSSSISLLRANGPALIDGTFSVTPTPFVQTIIVKVHDSAKSCYVPCVYALLTGKIEIVYLRLLNEVIMQTEYQWMPKSITCDFENGLIAAIQHEFPE
jgi:hypothetical protein